MALYEIFTVVTVISSEACPDQRKQRYSGLSLKQCPSFALSDMMFFHNSLTALCSCPAIWKQLVPDTALDKKGIDKERIQLKMNKSAKKS